jgi:hypothetical protein
MPEPAMTLAQTQPDEQHTGMRGGSATVLAPSQSPTALDEKFRALADDGPYGALHRALVRGFAQSDAEVWAHLVRDRACAVHPLAVGVA